MTHMLSEIDTAHFAVGPLRKAASGVMMQPVQYKGERGVDIQLDCACLFPPSGFEQSSARPSVTFHIDEATSAALGRVEAAVAAAADINTLHSALKHKEGYDPTFKVKIDPERCQYVDSKGAELKAMPEWRGLRLRAIVSPRSIYHQALCAGIVWELIAVQVLGPLPIKKAVFRQ